MLEELSQIDSFRKFNQAFEEYQRVKSDENANLINRYLAIISTIMDPKTFTPSNTDICQFYINIHELIRTMDAQSTVFWSTTAVLENVINLSKSKILSDKFRYLPPLVKLLSEVDSESKVMRLMNILQHLTITIRLTWDEPWLRPVMRELVKNMSSEEKNMVDLAAIVLTNLCYKNPVAAHILSFEIDFHKLFEYVEHNRVLKFKMEYILLEPSKNKFDLSCDAFMEAMFCEVEEALSQWDFHSLQQIVDFVSDVVRNHPKYISQCKTCAERVDRALSLPLSCKKWSEEVLKCFRQFLRLSSVLIPFFKNDNLFEILSELFKFSLDLCASEQSCLEAYSTIEVILKEKKDLLEDENNHQLFYEKLPELLSVLDLPGEAQIMSKFFKLLLSFVKVIPLKNILSKIDAVCFNSFICQLHSYNIIDAQSFGPDELEMIISGLKLLHTFAESQIISWKLQLDRALQFEAVHICLMKTIHTKDIDSIKMVFELLKIESLPIHALAGVFSHTSHVERLSTDVKNIERSNEFMHLGNPKLLNRIEEAVDKILNSNTIDHLHKPTIQDILEIFEYKLMMCDNQQRYLLHQIYEASNEVTYLRHQNAVLEAKVNEIRDEGHSFRMNRRKFEEHTTELNNQINTLKSQIDSGKEELNKSKRNNKELRKVISQKDREIKELSKEVNSLVDMITQSDLTVKNYVITIEEQESKLASLRHQVNYLGTVRNNLKAKINDKNREIEDAETQMKALDDENHSLIQKISELQKQLDEKNHIIADHEADLMEIERMKSRVIAIVQKKKDDDEAAAAREAEIKSPTKEVTVVTRAQTNRGGGDRDEVKSDGDNNGDDDEQNDADEDKSEIVVDAMK